MPPAAGAGWPPRPGLLADALGHHVLLPVQRPAQHVPAHANSHRQRGFTAECWTLKYHRIQDDKVLAPTVQDTMHMGLGLISCTA